MAIKCKGRNGRFSYDHHWAGVVLYPGQKHPVGYVEIFSNSPHTRSAPIELDGPALEVIRLLRQIARELEADYRANKAHNVNKQESEEEHDTTTT
jgi:hypothetical protein